MMGVGEDVVTKIVDVTTRNLAIVNEILVVTSMDELIWGGALGWTT